MWVMLLRARVTACRVGRMASAWTGTSVRVLSSSHRWRKDARPLKELSGTLAIWLASNRLTERRSVPYIKIFLENTVINYIQSAFLRILKLFLWSGHLSVHLE
jgi:hypothetical protein